MKEIINRPTYTDRIAPFIGKSIIKALTGQRRVGKNCLLQQLSDHIRQSHPTAKILFINKELSTFSHIRTSDDLLAAVTKTFTPAGDGGCYLFIDEVHDIQGFEHAFRSLLAEEAYGIYVTGSNATMLSGELATTYPDDISNFMSIALLFPNFCNSISLKPITSPCVIISLSEACRI